MCLLSCQACRNCTASTVSTSTSTISTLGTVSTFSTSEREYKRLLEGVGDPAEEARRVGAVDHAVVVGEREREHQPRLELGAVPDRLQAAPGDPQDRDLGPVDD